MNTINLIELIYNFNERDFRWLWNFLRTDNAQTVSGNYQELATWDEFDSIQTRKEQLSELLQQMPTARRSDLASEILGAKQERLIPGHEFKDRLDGGNNRLLIFLLAQLQYGSGGPNFNGTRTRLCYESEILGNVPESKRPILRPLGTYPSDDPPSSDANFTMSDAKRPTYQSMWQEPLADGPLESWPCPHADLSNIPKQVRKKAFIYFLDAWPRTAEFKLHWLDEKLGVWGRITHPRYESFFTKWIKKEDISQLHWISRYLVQKRITTVSLPVPVRTSEEHLLQILANVDGMAEAPATEKRYFFEIMKRGWSQAKYRKKRQSKSPHNVLLTKTSGNKLNKMVAEWGMNKSSIIDWLIKEAPIVNSKALHEDIAESADSPNAAAYEPYYNPNSDELI